MSFAGVILFELGYDGETVRQHEFEGYSFDNIVETIEGNPAWEAMMRRDVDHWRHKAEELDRELAYWKAHHGTSKCMEFDRVYPPGLTLPMEEDEDE